MGWEHALEIANLAFAGVVCVATVGAVAVQIGWHDPNQREIGRLNALSEFIERVPADRRPAFDADFARRVDRLERRLSAARGTTRYWWIALVALVICLLGEVLQLLLLGPGRGVVWTMPLLAILAGLGVLFLLGALFLTPLLPRPLRGLGRWGWLFVPALALMFVEVLRADNETDWVASAMTFEALVVLWWMVLAMLIVAVAGYTLLLLIPRGRRWLSSRLRTADGGKLPTRPSVSGPSGNDDDS